MTSLTTQLATDTTALTALICNDPKRLRASALSTLSQALSDDTSVLIGLIESILRTPIARPLMTW
jgi:hypothetical protein